MIRICALHSPDLLDGRLLDQAATGIFVRDDNGFGRIQDFGGFRHEPDAAKCNDIAVKVAGLAGEFQTIANYISNFLDLGFLVVVRQNDGPARCFQSRISSTIVPVANIFSALSLYCNAIDVMFPTVDRVQHPEPFRSRIRGCETHICCGGNRLHRRAVVARLVESGHRVTMLARPGSARKVPRGADVLIGDALTASTFQCLGPTHSSTWLERRIPRLGKARSSARSIYPRFTRLSRWRSGRK